MNASRFVKLISLVLCLTLILTVAPVSFAGDETGEGEDFSYVDGHYYYYPKGTEFVSAIQVGWYKMTNDVKASRAAAIANAEQGGFTVLNDKENPQGVNTDGAVYLVYLAIKKSTDVNDALTDFRCVCLDKYPSIPTPESHSEQMVFTANGQPVTYNRFTTFEGEECNLNKEHGNYVYGYYTKDPIAGFPVNSLYITLQNYEETPSHLPNYRLMENGDTGEAADMEDRGKGDNSYYLNIGDFSIYTDVTDTINSLSDALTVYESLRGSNYTRESWNAATEAYNSALSMVRAYKESGNAWNMSCEYSEEELNAGLENLNNALNNLTTTITLNASANGGACDTLSYDIVCGTNTSLPVFPAGNFTAAKDAPWEFLGWSEDENSKEGSKTDMTVGFMSTVYAIFKANVSATVHYTDSLGAVAAKEYSADVYNKESAADFTFDGEEEVVKNGATYSLRGFTLEPDSFSPDFSEGETITVSSSSLDVYAVYSVQHNLKYDANKGENAPSDTLGYMYYNYDLSSHGSVSYTVTSDEPTYAGHSFKGWADTEDGEVLYQAGGTVTADGDKTVYAAWESSELTVTFKNPKTGVVLATKTVNYGDGVEAPAIDKEFIENNDETHYCFTGWDHKLTNITESVTINAEYIEEAHGYDVTSQKEANCVDKGEKISTCGDCGHVKTEEIPVNPENHKDIQSFDKKDPTCAENGFTAGTECKACGAILTGHDDIPALGHKESSDFRVITKATCEKDGSKTKYCLTCGENLGDHVVIEKRGHNWDEGKITKSPDCQNTGTKLFTCKNKGDDEYEECSETYEETLDKTPHHGGKATCSTLAICDSCGKEYGTYDKNNHENIVEVPGKDPTCLEAGYTKSTKCQACGQVILKSEPIPALGHVDENSDNICDRCNENLSSGGTGSYTCPFCDNFNSLIENTSDTFFGKSLRIALKALHSVFHTVSHLVYLFKNLFS